MNKGAAIALSWNRILALNYQTRLAGLVGLYIGDPPGFVKPVFWRDCREWNQLVDI